MTVKILTPIFGGMMGATSGAYVGSVVGDSAGVLMRLVIVSAFAALGAYLGYLDGKDTPTPASKETSLEDALKGSSE